MNYQKISADISKLLIMALYNFDHPITSKMSAAEINMRDQRAFEVFNNDPTFNARVRLLTAGLIGIIQHHEDVEKHGEAYVEQKRKFNEILLDELFQSGRMTNKTFMEGLLNNQ
jgi:hypothetical protein